ncbi:MAG: polysaccharide deacetylase family protein [Prolixibacteraceae bacterium]|nr:polysaccharide deacetylase family protein [Prolixibacteraceae bacterium]
MNKTYKHYIKNFLGLILLLVKIFIPYRKRQILSIYFHNPSPIVFERVIRYLTKKGYKFTPLNQFEEVIRTKKLDQKIAVITIDDGFRNNLNLLDIIKKYNVYTTIFVTTSAIEEGNFWFEFVGDKGQSKETITREKIRLKKLDENSFAIEINNLKAKTHLFRTALTEQELIELTTNPLIAIESHTVTHPSMPYISENAQRKELLNSKIILEKLTNKEVNYFAYPMGDYTERLKILAKESGYRLCFSCETIPIELNKLDVFSIPRRCVNDDAGYYEALSKVYGIWDYVKNKISKSE